MPTYRKLLSFTSYGNTQLCQTNKNQTDNIMESVNTEHDKDSSAAMSAVTSKTKVLAIGDSEESSTDNKRISKYDRYNFREDFKSHLGYLLVGTRNPIDVIDDWDIVWRFGASVQDKGNHVRRYRFHCVKGNSWLPGTLINGPALCGREVMDVVRKQLKEENWVSDNAIETPFKTPHSKEYYNCDQYIQHVVSVALNSQISKLFLYLLHLHREYVKNKKQ
ncbi:uncharacterized protein LOC132792757 [Drosophila nasuta]|uniref:uncharacterized protein LOC132792757 n=1 Tax=Drosophila nasuta TaxID=42062 RepID=UPI00295E687B|nr:uncharacterized protein LOC132792757 [Drosophila nasuta]